MVLGNLALVLLAVARYGHCQRRVLDRIGEARGGGIEIGLKVCLR